MIDLFGSGEVVSDDSPRSDALTVIQELTVGCNSCRLGQTCDRNNTGMVYSGPTTAEIAVLGDTLEYECVSQSGRSPLSSMSLATFRDWLQELNSYSRTPKNELIGRFIREDDIFFLNATQCKTQRTKKDKFREALRDEVSVCFPDRALRVLQSLPDLKILITLGMTAAAAILGWDPMPTSRSHEGVWFGTDYLPDVAVFCLNHPRDYTRETEARKVGRLSQCLQFLNREYLLGDQPKILPIQGDRKQQRARFLADQ